MAMDGIGRLITVTQMKSNNANEEAMHGADKQRDIINAQKTLRGQQRALEDKVRDKVVSGADEAQIRDMMGKAGISQVGISFARDGEGNAKLGAEGAEKTNQDMVDSIKAKFQDAVSALESEDKLGNFEIQDLMSTFNQAETLASSVLKKRDDTGNAVIGKV
jgi:hypothetical protein